MLDQIAPNLYAAETNLRLGPGIVFPTRMTAVDISGDLLLYSPLEIDEELEADLRSLGEVRWIIAPNDHHHLFAASAAEAFPEAEVWGTEGAAANEPGVDFDGSLSELAASPPEAWSEALQLLELQGTRFWHEFVLHFMPGDTLLCADFVFNIQSPPNRLTSFVLWLVGGRGKLAQTRTERWIMVRDRAAFAESVSQILAWECDRIVMAHGDIVETDGYRRLREVTRWTFKGNEHLLETDA